MLKTVKVNVIIQKAIISTDADKTESSWQKSLSINVDQLWRCNVL